MPIDKAAAEDYTQGPVDRAESAHRKLERTGWMGFADQWLWLIFVVIGLLLGIAELLGGIETELDMAIVGSALILGGLITSPLQAWPATVGLTAAICIAYVFVGRRYVKRWVQTRETKTNIDAVIGSRGVVLRSITSITPGRVRVGNQEWRASAEEDIAEGAEIIVKGVRGATLIVSKNGGD